MDKLPRVTTLFPLASIFLLLLSGCENHKPTYEELMNDNQQLHAQLDATSQKIQDDLSGRADDIDSDLDEAQQESQ
jgi:outer membrane murein-binding lipoprotein Lpp